MNKTVIITGRTSGYGLASAKAFKNAGYTVLSLHEIEKIY